MQREWLRVAVQHVSGLHAVFVISAWAGRRTVCARMYLCVHTEGEFTVCVFGVGMAALLKKDLSMDKCMMVACLLYTDHAHGFTFSDFQNENRLFYFKCRVMVFI